MGIYDREYYRHVQRPGLARFAPRSMVVTLIVINVAIWLIDGLFLNGLCKGMAVHVSTLTHPLDWWQFLTAGFAHSPNAVGHILVNMLVLYMFGRDIEDTYGPREFLAVYLVAIVVANLGWTVVNRLLGTPGDTPAYGASGAITAILILYALNFPKRTILAFFVLPMPAWLFGVFCVALDMFGAIGGESNTHVAYINHLSGAAFAFLYYEQRWSFTRLAQSLHWPKFSFRRKPRLKVHQPDREEEGELSQEVERILEKITREG
ncbi:MAG: rhomboid family intramembrane serine protease, partial [Thermoguttaceae bacterium]